MDPQRIWELMMEKVVLGNTIFFYFLKSDPRHPLCSALELSHAEPHFLSRDAVGSHRPVMTGVWLQLWATLSGAV